MERHISSFFQVYGSRPLRLNKVETASETPVYKETTQQLQDRFNSELADRSLAGYRETIHEICLNLQTTIEELRFDERKGFGVYETDVIKLYLLSFDALVRNFESLLGHVTGKRMKKIESNLSEQKFYNKKYAEFKATLRVPHQVVLDVYNKERDIINLISSGRFDAVLDQAIARYAG